ncbi:MAG TPA: hypothetical protein VGZ22_16790 [Isosphaeraceae bacterium]|jgi:hypothetical protein|nr:hypothetical protein [Isosphaeraceae bacterium]
MISEQKRQANQRNAQKSTGPRTEAGKAQSRRNAWKHGLTGEGVVVSRPDKVRIKARVAELSGHLQPIDPLEKILVARVAASSVRLEKCVTKEAAENTKCQKRAIKRWQAKHQKGLNAAVERVEQRPAEAVAALTSTSFGCGWLLDEWEALAGILDEEGHWTRELAVQALRLLGQDQAEPLTGAAAWLWQHAMALRPGENGDRQTALAGLREIIADEQDRLEALGDRLWSEQDEPAKDEVEDCAGVVNSESLVRLQRYEHRSEMDMHRNLNQLIGLRKIEPEHQSVERWHKTGKLGKPRRWDGTNWAPNRPYVTNWGGASGVGDEGPGMGDGQPLAADGNQGMEDGRTLVAADSGQEMGHGSDLGPQNQGTGEEGQMTGAVGGENEATETGASREGGCGFVDDQEGYQNAISARPESVLAGSIAFDSWPEPVAEAGDDEASA